MGYKLLGCFWQFSLELLWSVILKLKSNLSLAISCFVCTKMKQSLQLPWRKAIAVHRITFARVWAAATEKKILCQFSKKKVTPLQGHSFGGCAQKWHGTRMGTYHKFPSIGLCRGYAACLQVNPERSWKLDSVSCTEPPPLHSFIPPDQHRLKHLKGIYHWINTSLVQQDYQGVLCAFLMCH